MEEAGAQAPAPPVRPSPSRFTALELAAAEHLIHLSESSSSAAAFGPASVGSAASSSSSPRSVNAPAVPRGGGLAALGAEDDEDEQEVGGRRRRNKRYRPIAEIYALTAPKLKLKPIRERGGRKDKVRPKQAAGSGKEARK